MLDAAENQTGGNVTRRKYYFGKTNKLKENVKLIFCFHRNMYFHATHFLSARGSQILRKQIMKKICMEKKLFLINKISIFNINNHKEIVMQRRIFRNMRY